MFASYVDYISLNIVPNPKCWSEIRAYLFEVLQLITVKIYICQITCGVLPYFALPFVYSTFPNRPGAVHVRQKPSETSMKVVVSGAGQLLETLGLCDPKAADYFGLLAKGDCISVTSTCYYVVTLQWYKQCLQ